MNLPLDDLGRYELIWSAAMDLKQKLMQEGMKLMSNPKVMKLMQDKRVMKAVMTAMSLPAKVSTLRNGGREGSPQVVSAWRRREIDLDAPRSAS